MSGTRARSTWREACPGKFQGTAVNWPLTHRTSSKELLHTSRVNNLNPHSVQIQWNLVKVTVTICLLWQIVTHSVTGDTRRQSWQHQLRQTDVITSVGHHCSMCRKLSKTEQNLWESFIRVDRKGKRAKEPSCLTLCHRFGQSNNLLLKPQNTVCEMWSADEGGRRPGVTNASA